MTSDEIRFSSTRYYRDATWAAGTPGEPARPGILSATPQPHIPPSPLCERWGAWARCLDVYLGDQLVRRCVAHVAVPEREQAVRGALASLRASGVTIGADVHQLLGGWMHSGDDIGVLRQLVRAYYGVSDAAA